MDKMYKLFEIVFPNSDFAENTNLFLNIKSQKLIVENIVGNYTIFSTDSWMNMFPVIKYTKYCYIEDLYLTIKLNQNAKIQILNINYNAAFPDYSEIIESFDINANEIVNYEIKDFKKYENLYIRIITSDENLRIDELFWGTTTSPETNNKLAIVTCTYKREEYIQKNILSFNEFISKNPELAERISMIVVDNGKTLDKSLENDNIKIIPNINAGGAGGFTRGIIEAKNSRDNYTRILLMDDDVLVLSESFYRTLIFSDYLKQVYKNSFIHGGMLKLCKKNIFFESNAIHKKNWVKSFYDKNDISYVKNITKLNYAPEELYNDEDKKVSSAWWYCCFPLDLVYEKGLPMPVFFRCDDIEWSWRNFGEHHISMNGICVWHSPFEWRVSKPVEWYFSKRNWYFCNILYTKNYKKILLKNLRKDFNYLLGTYDYTSDEIYLEMMRDLLNGDLSFREHPEKLMKRIFSLSKNDKYEPIKSLSVVNKLKKTLLILEKHPGKIKRKLLFKKILYFITLKSKLVPQIFWVKCGACSLRYMNKAYFYFTKRVNVYNLLTNKYEVRTKNSKKEKELRRKFNVLYSKIKNNYSSIEKCLTTASEEFKTEKFWNSYLKE